MCVDEPKLVNKCLCWRCFELTLGTAKHNTIIPVLGHFILAHHRFPLATSHMCHDLTRCNWGHEVYRMVRSGSEGHGLVPSVRDQLSYQSKGLMTPRLVTTSHANSALASITLIINSKWFTTCIAWYLHQLLWSWNWFETTEDQSESRCKCQVMLIGTKLCWRLGCRWWHELTQAPANAQHHHMAQGKHHHSWSSSPVPRIVTRSSSQSCCNMQTPSKDQLRPVTRPASDGVYPVLCWWCWVLVVSHVDSCHHQHHQLCQTAKVCHLKPMSLMLLIASLWLCAASVVCSCHRHTSAVRHSWWCWGWVETQVPVMMRPNWNQDTGLRWCWTSRLVCAKLANKNADGCIGFYFGYQW